MKFHIYLNENDTPQTMEDIVEILKRDCMPMLKFLKKLGWRYLFHRYTDPPKNRFELKFSRTNRKPLDTPLWLHYFIDDLLYQKFGWKPRSEGVFVWPEPIGETHGTFCVFPVDTFDLIWSPQVGDFYAVYRDLDDWGEKKISKEEIEKWINSIIPTYRSLEHIRSDINFNRHEVVFKCHKYYLLAIPRSITEFDGLIESLKGV